MATTKAAVMLLCAAVNIYFEDAPVSVRLVPRGNCNYCCPMDVRRDVTFLLYTRNNTQRPDVLVPGDSVLLERSHLNRDLPTVIYLHGFTEDHRGHSAQAIKNAYLVRGGWNIILVNWSSLVAAPFYVTAVRNCREVGQYLAQFIEFLDSRGVSMSTIHVVGFSLGAEVAGFAGQHLNGKLPRITGLDPAYPLFTGSDLGGHLSSDDAQFVDVIHTDGGVFGHPSALGHVDFFPNSGRLIQPGCEALLFGGPVRKPVSQYVACSHQRAWRYYAESVINECGFLSSRCNSWSRFRRGACRGRSIDDVTFMGIASKNMTARGMFFLKTGTEYPYSNNPGCPVHGVQGP